MQQGNPGPHLIEAGEAEHAHLRQDEGPVPVAVQPCEVPIQVLPHLLHTAHQGASSPPSMLAKMATSVQFAVSWHCALQQSRSRRLSASCCMGHICFFVSLHILQAFLSNILA